VKEWIFHSGNETVSPSSMLQKCSSPIFAILVLIPSSAFREKKKAFVPIRSRPAIQSAETNFALTTLTGQKTSLPLILPKSRPPKPQPKNPLNSEQTLNIKQIKLS
jgi:hypothetical protein